MKYSAGRALAVVLTAAAMTVVGCDRAETTATQQPAALPPCCAQGETTPTMAGSETKMSVKKESFGKTADGREVDLYTLTNKYGLKAKVMTYGATLTEVEVPDRKGKIENVNLNEKRGVGHLNMDKNPELQARVVDFVLEVLGEKPAKAASN